MAENDPGQTGILPILEGLWWGLTPRREAKVMVANTSNAPVAADVYLSFGGQRHTSAPLAFRPHETKVLSIREFVAKLGFHPDGVSEGGITIMGHGTTPALIATGMVADQETGFSTTMHFLLMGTPVSSALYANGIPVGTPSAESPFALAGTFTPHVIVRNLLSTEQIATITVEYPTADGSREVTLAPLTLGAYAIRDLVLDGAVLAQLPLPLPYCSIRVEYGGRPGSALVGISSVEENKNLVVDSKLRDLADPVTGSGINPWHLDDETEAVLFLTNAGEAPARIGFQIQAEGVHYYLTDLQLSPRETRAVDIRKLRDAQQPDFKGSRIPPNATDGSLVWIRLDKVPVVGRLLVLSSRRGISSNFNCVCTFHCPTGYFSLAVSPTSVDIPLGSTQQFTATERYGDCYGTLHPYNYTCLIDDPTFRRFWSSGASSISSVNSCGVATAVGAGSATITATFTDTKPKWFVADQTCLDNYITISASATVTVKPLISGPNLVWYFNGLSPSGYATSITLTSSGGASTSWTITAGANKINLSSTTGSSTNVTSSGSAFSSAVGDIQITATAGGQTSNPFSLTTRAPNRAVPGAITTSCDSTFGYLTTLNYTIQDQLQTALPSGAPLNENWTTGVVNDFNGTNWRRGEPNGVPLSSSAFADTIGGEDLALSPMPVPTCDGNSTAIQHWGQEFRVGSVSPGFGRRIQTNTLQKYKARAAHLSIVSPAP